MLDTILLILWITGGPPALVFNLFLIGVLAKVPSQLHGLHVYAISLLVSRFLFVLLVLVLVVVFRLSSSDWTSLACHALFWIWTTTWTTDVLTTLLMHVAGLIHVASGCTRAGTVGAEVTLACVWFGAFVASGFPVYFRDDVIVFDAQNEKCHLLQEYQLETARIVFLVVYTVCGGLTLFLFVILVVVSQRKLFRINKNKETEANGIHFCSNHMKESAKVNSGSSHPEEEGKNLKSMSLGDEIGTKREDSDSNDSGKALKLRRERVLAWRNVSCVAVVCTCCLNIIPQTVLLGVETLRDSHVSRDDDILLSLALVHALVLPFVLCICCFEFRTNVVRTLNLLFCVKSKSDSAMGLGPKNAGKYQIGKNGRCGRSIEDLDQVDGSVAVLETNAVTRDSAESSSAGAPPSAPPIGRTKNGQTKPEAPVPPPPPPVGWSSQKNKATDPPPAPPPPPIGGGSKKHQNNEGEGPTPPPPPPPPPPPLPGEKGFAKTKNLESTSSEDASHQSSNMNSENQLAFRSDPVKTTSSFLLTADDITNARASLRKNKPSTLGERPPIEKPPKAPTFIDWRSEMQTRKKKPAIGAVVATSVDSTSSNESTRGNEKSFSSGLGSKTPNGNPAMVPSISLDGIQENTSNQNIMQVVGKSEDPVNARHQTTGSEVKGNHIKLHGNHTAGDSAKSTGKATGNTETVVVHVHVSDSELLGTGNETGSESSSSGSLEQFTENDITVVLEGNTENVAGTNKERTRVTKELQKSNIKPYRSQSAVVTPVTAARTDSRAKRLQEKARKLILRASRKNSASVPGKGSQPAPPSEHRESKLQRNWSDRLKNLIGILEQAPAKNPFLDQAVTSHVNPFLDSVNPDDTEVLTITVKSEGGGPSTNPFHEGKSGNDVTYTIRRPKGSTLETSTSLPAYIEQNPFLPSAVPAIPPTVSGVPPLGYHPYGLPTDYHPPYSAPIQPYPPLSTNNPFFQDVHPGAPFSYREPDFTNPRDYLRYPSTNPQVTWSAMRGRNNHLTQRWRTAATAVNIADYLRRKNYPATQETSDKSSTQSVALDGERNRTYLTQYV